MNHTVEEIKLKNGAKGLLVNVPSALVVDFYVAFNAGFLLGQKTKHELPHVMEHMMFTNKTYPKKNQFKIEFQRNGAYINAYTSSELVSYDYQCAAFETERILDLVAIQLTEPIFLKEELVTEVGNVSEELRNYLSDNQQLCGEKLYSAMTGNPGLEERLKQLKSITSADISNHYKHTHTAANMRFIIAGNVTAKTLQLFESKMSELPAGERLSVPAVRYKPVKNPPVTNRDIEQTYYYFMSERMRQYSFRKVTAARLINRILTDGYRSKIYGKARERGLAYSVFSKVEADLHDTGFWIGGFVSLDNRVALFKLIAKELRNVLQGKFTNKEFEEAKQRARGNFARHYQTTGNLVTWYSSYSLFETYEDFTNYPDMLDDITRQEAISAFAELFEEKCLGMSFVGNITDEQAEKLQKILLPNGIERGLSK